MGKVLTTGEIADYDRLGYHFPVPTLNAEETGNALAKFEAFEQNEGGEISGKRKIKSHLFLRWAYELIAHPGVLDAVEDVLGPNILCWNSSFFIKNAHDPAHVTWHQDSTYWGLSVPDLCSVWIALTPATVENGAMKIIPESHRHGQLDHTDTFDKTNLLARGQHLTELPAENSAVDIELAPGEISLHHIMAVHGSEPNRTDERRIGLAIRYAAPHVRLLGNISDSALLVRGKDDHGHFGAETPPEKDMDPTALDQHAQILENRARVKYAGTEKDYAHKDD
ncbi:MAG TPA: phytanoyl-CoA dioxygenase [Rhodospirillaceae bacterium]|nr:phytanoyl-CoA dioxygenase [Rhodospirillaceae bacterium]HAA93250.1 phytanoyl-CoA dioxygenase [Rhodospirillaceae bacterium]HAT35288.1 phytanoyl-CoA dioxygenase [Rhodospirillaceae bacterium]